MSLLIASPSIIFTLIIFFGIFDNVNSESNIKFNRTDENKENGLVFSGHWKNQDDSVMFMRPVTLTKYSVEWEGWYHSAVGLQTKKSTPGNYSLTGRSYIMEGNQIISWNVIWANDQAEDYSLTAWNGFVDSNQKQDIRMEANWILTYGKAASWNDTMIGEDFFVKVRP